MHEALASRNSLPGPASREADPSAAFHLPSGEHGCCPLQGTLPLFSTSKVCTALPTLISVRAFIEYRTRTFPTLICGWSGGILVTLETGTMCATYSLSPTHSGHPKACISGAENTAWPP